MIDDNDDDGCGAVSRMELQVKPKHSEETCSNAALSSTYLHMSWPGLEPGPPQWEAGV
jgi:hypothetical protein